MWSFLRRLLGRKDPPAPDRAVVADPSGRVVTDHSQHLVTQVGASFWIHANSPVPGHVVWHSSDTAVGRLEVAADGRSAVVRAMGPGTCTLRVSDRLTSVSRQLVVKPKPAEEATPLTVSVHTL